MTPASPIPRALVRHLPWRVWLGVLAWAGMVVVLARGGGVQREVRCEVRFDAVGPCWEVGWRSARTGRHDGHWIDLADQAGVSNDGRSGLSSPEPIVLSRRLPIYGLDEIDLAWQMHAGGRAFIQRAEVITRVLGRPLSREPLVLLRVEGATRSPRAEALDLSGLGASGRVVWAAGGPPGSAYATIALAAIPLAAALIWLPGVLCRLACVAGRAFPHRDRAPPPRWLGALTALVVVGVPAWLLWASPMFLSADSTAYVWFAQIALQTRSVAHFDGWRLPGFAMLILPFLATGFDYVLGVGIVHALLAVLSSWLVFSMVRSRIGGVWPHLAAIFAAADPVVIVWQRHLLAEHLGGVLVLTACWLALRLADRRGGAWGWIALALVLALAAYTRANLQVFLVLLPLGAGLAQCLRERARGWLRRAAPAIGCLLLSAGLLLPAVVHNARTFGRVTLTVGLEWNRLLWLWDYGAVDWNQSGTLTFDQFRELRRRCQERSINAWGVTDLLAQWRAEEGPPGRHPWADRDERCEQVWRESDARRPLARWESIARGVGVHIGWYTLEPRWAYSERADLLNPMLARPAPHQTSTAITPLDRFPQPIRAELERAAHPLDPPGLSRRALGWAFDASLWAHHAVALAFLLGMLRAWWARDWALLAVGAVLLAHAVAMPLLTFTWNSRYSMPLMGVEAALAVMMLLGARSTPPGGASRAACDGAPDR